MSLKDQRCSVDLQYRTKGGARGAAAQGANLEGAQEGQDGQTMNLYLYN